MLYLCSGKLEMLDIPCFLGHPSRQISPPDSSTPSKNGRVSNVLEKFLIFFRKLFRDVSALKVAHVELYNILKLQELTIGKVILYYEMIYDTVIS